MNSLISFFRRRLPALLLVFALTAALIPVLPAETVSASGFVIVIDPGHDSTHARGACSVSGITEEITNLAIANSLKTQLENAGFTVYITHSTIACPSSSSTNGGCLDARVSYAASKGCDLFVSIHLNASGNDDGQWRSTNGSFIYIASQYKTSMSALAAKVSANLASYCSLNQLTPNGFIQYSSENTYSNGAKADYLRIMRDATNDGFPSILIEHGYMDNSHDANLIKNLGAYTFAKADCDAIVSWYKDKYGSSSVSGSSSGSSAGTAAYVTASTLNLRSGASTSSSVVAKLSRNDPLTLFESSNGWYRAVAYHNGTTYSGYVSGSYVSTGTPSGLSGGTSAYVSSKTLNLRQSPTTSASKVVVLSKNDSLKLYEKTNGWYRVTAVHQGTSYNGYVSGDYITVGSSGSSSSGSSTGSSSGSSGSATVSTGFVSAAKVNLRSGPATSYQLLTTLVQYDGMTVTGTSGNWYKVTAVHNGKSYTGYVYNTYITLGSYGKTGTVNYTYLNVRKGAGTGYALIDKLYLNDKVMIIASSGSWYQIKYVKDGSVKTGYVSKSYIS